MYSHGGKREGAGRPRLADSILNKRLTTSLWRINNKPIYLKKIVHATWKELRIAGKFSYDTKFASHLLSLEIKNKKRYEIYAPIYIHGTKLCCLCKCIFGFIM